MLTRRETVQMLLPPLIKGRKYLLRLSSELLSNKFELKEKKMKIDWLRITVKTDAILFEMNVWGEKEERLWDHYHSGHGSISIPKSGSSRQMVSISRRWCRPDRLTFGHGHGSISIPKSGSSANGLLRISRRWCGPGRLTFISILEFWFCKKV